MTDRMTDQKTEQKTLKLKLCPFCGCEMRVVSNQDWHKLFGYHPNHCVFFDDEPVMTVPATDCQLEVMVHDWNTRNQEAA